MRRGAPTRDSRSDTLSRCTMGAPRPLTLDPAKCAGLRVSAHLVRALRTAAAPVSVLLLQHEPAAAASIAATLRQAGFRVSVADEGPPTVGRTTIDVVALGMKGDARDRVGACERLRADGYPGAIVVVGASPRDVESLLDAGADDFVPAPVRDAELI